MSEDNLRDCSPAFHGSCSKRRTVRFTGFSGQGKTALIERLIVLATAAGRRVGTIKHTHHSGPFMAGRGDSARFHAAGAVEAILAGADEALLESSGDRFEWSRPEELRDRLPHALDLILVEGFRDWKELPRICVQRHQNPDAVLSGDCIAVVTGDMPPHTTVPHFRFSDLAGLLSFIDTIDPR